MLEIVVIMSQVLVTDNIMSEVVLSRGKRVLVGTNCHDLWLVCCLVCSANNYHHHCHHHHHHQHHHHQCPHHLYKVHGGQGWRGGGRASGGDCAQAGQGLRVQARQAG